jgi:hypothetical protein
MRNVSVLEKDKSHDRPPCLEVLARLQLNGYRFRFRREATGYKPDPRFRPFFWKGDDDDEKVGPMFPRLHVNDTTDKGGPRAPPRNKMALYEQFTVPFQRFNPNSNSSNSLPLTPSSIMVSL